MLDEIDSTIKAMKAYIELVDACKNYNQGSFFRELSVSMAELYTNGLQLADRYDCAEMASWVEESIEEEDEDEEYEEQTDDETPEERERLDRRYAIYKRTESKLNTYLGSINVYNLIKPYPITEGESEEAYETTLSNDLAEIYEDLVELLPMLENRTVEPVEFIVRFDHWGDHLTRVLYVIHGLIAWFYED